MDPVRAPAALDGIAAALDRGLLPARIFADPDIFELEVRRLFGRVWLFVGHESEIPNAGDYVTRRLLRDSVIFVRGKDGQSRVLLNVCRHRGARICRTEQGSAASFICPYHGWTYANTGQLIAVPGAREAYGGLPDSDEWGLRPLPRVASWHGLVFASFSHDAPPLEDHLGGMTWYLDLLANRTPLGLEVAGPPQRWVIPANWKYPADNFVGDTYHTTQAHASAVQVGLLAARADVGRAGVTVSVEVDGGHSARAKWFPDGSPTYALRGYPESFGELVRRSVEAGKLSRDQAAMVERSAFMGGYVFPNLAYFNPIMGSDLESPAVSFISLRIWQPLAVNATEIRSWLLVEKEAPPEVKDAARKAYTRNFGPAGNLEQDDVELWRSATESTAGLMGGQLLQNVSIQLDDNDLDPSFPGPGKASTAAFSERCQRAFYRQWLSCLLAP